MVLAIMAKLVTMVLLVMATIAVISLAVAQWQLQPFLQVKTIRRVTAAARSSSAALWKLRKGTLQQQAARQLPGEDRTVDLGERL